MIRQANNYTGRKTDTDTDMQIEILTHIKIIRTHRKTRTRTDDDRQIHGRLASRQNQKGNQL